MAEPNGSLRRTLPNAITTARLVLAAAFFVVLEIMGADFTAPGRATWGLVAVALFIVAAATDAVDGWLARKWQVTSVFGRVMDPFVDKVLVIGAFIYLAGPALADPAGAPPELSRPLTGVAPWMVVAIVARELLVTSVRAVVEASGVSFGADRWGKLKMVLQCIAVPTALLVATSPWALESAAWRWARDIAVWIAVFATIASAFNYLVRGARLLAPARG